MLTEDTDKKVGYAILTMVIVMLLFLVVFTVVI